VAEARGGRAEADILLGVVEPPRLELEVVLDQQPAGSSKSKERILRLAAGSAARLDCRVVGGRPAPGVHWSRQRTTPSTSTTSTSGGEEDKV
jgi:hypothetical protein